MVNDYLTPIRFYLLQFGGNEMKKIICLGNGKGMKKLLWKWNGDGKYKKGSKGMEVIFITAVRG